MEQRRDRLIPSQEDLLFIFIIELASFKTCEILNPINEVVVVINLFEIVRKARIQLASLLELVLQTGWTV